MVELHLLVVQGEGEHGGGQEVAAPQYGRHGEEQEAEAGRVILEVSVVYEDEGGQGEQGGQGGGPGG